MVYYGGTPQQSRVVLIWGWHFLAGPNQKLSNSIFIKWGYFGAKLGVQYEVLLNGIPTDLHICVLGLKGDWPALTKLGCLTRHHGREASVKDGAGICHLCLAGQRGHEFHIFDYTKMKASRAPDWPWTKPSSLTTVNSTEPHPTRQILQSGCFSHWTQGCHGGYLCKCYCCLERKHTRVLYLFVFVSFWGVSPKKNVFLYRRKTSEQVTLFDLKIDDMANLIWAWCSLFTTRVIYEGQFVEFAYAATFKDHLRFPQFLVFPFCVACQVQSMVRLFHHCCVFM